MKSYSHTCHGLREYRCSVPVVAVALGFLMMLMPQLCQAQEELLFGPEDIATWKSSIAAGQVELDDGLAVISGGGGWGGGVASPWLSIDLAKLPVLTITVEKISHQWVLKLGLDQKDDAWGPYIQGDTGTLGEQSYNLPEALKDFPAGVEPPDADQSIDGQIRVWGVGDGGAKVWVSSIRLIYEGDPNDRPRFVDPELEAAYVAETFAVEPLEKLSTRWASLKQM